MSIVETKRMILRPYESTDLAPLFAIQNDPAAMQYAFFAASLGECERFHTVHANQRGVNGFAPWVAVLKAESKMAGWGGLMIDPFDPGWGIEVAYFIHPGHRGLGLATELVRAALEHGFDTLGLDEIGAFARPANTASITVLERSGFNLIGYEPKLARNRYKVVRSGWRRPRRAGARPLRKPARKL